jgi:hypothetical protein
VATTPGRGHLIRSPTRSITTGSDADWTWRWPRNVGFRGHRQRLLTRMVSARRDIKPAARPHMRIREPAEHRHRRPQSQPPGHPVRTSTKPGGGSPVPAGRNAWWYGPAARRCHPVLDRPWRRRVRRNRHRRRAAVGDRSCDRPGTPTRPYSEAPVPTSGSSPKPHRTPPHRRARSLKSYLPGEDASAFVRPRSSDRGHVAQAAPSRGCS